MDEQGNLFYVEISKRLNEIEKALRDLSVIDGRLDSINRALINLEHEIKIQNGRVRSLEEWRAAQMAISSERGKLFSTFLKIINHDAVRWVISLAISLILAGVFVRGT